MQVDEIYNIMDAARIKETERLELDRQSKKLKKEEDDLKALLIQRLNSLGLRELTHNGFAAVISQNQKPYIVDFEALEQYVIDNKALDLLQKRLTETAVKDRWGNGVAIPGIGVMTEDKLKFVPRRS
jgi:hypothetical protein